MSKDKQRKIYEMAHDYFINNFHKFTQSEKLRASLQIILKYIPQKLEGVGGDTNITIVRPGENKESISIMRPTGAILNASIDS